MSDTPRTDAELRKPIHGTGIYNNLTEFCQSLERENAELMEAINLACDDRDYFMNLQEKEKARLEYLLREYNIYRFGHEDRLDRDDIDEAMKEEEQ